jgi:hypothetical protein
MGSMMYLFLAFNMHRCTATHVVGVPRLIIMPQFYLD